MGKSAGPLVASRLATVNKALHTWSRDVLGDLQKRACKMKEELERVISYRYPRNRSEGGLQ